MKFIRRNIGKILTLFILEGVVLYFVFTRVNSLQFVKRDVSTPLPTMIIRIPTVSHIPARSLQQSVAEALEGTQEGTYAVVIKNLKTGERYTFNEAREFNSGSLYKLWVMTTAFHQIQLEKLNEDEVLQEDIAVLNELFQIATDSAEQTEGTITLTVKEAIEQMITLSDNYAALLLAARVKNSNVSEFFKNNGLVQSKLGEPPITTASDIALFFEKLYLGRLANQEQTTEMIDILKRQTINTKIPKYLPKGVSIAHKTGELGPFSHDAGIVYSDTGDYIIVVLSESENPTEAEERIANISQNVYKYFSRP